MCLYKVEGEIPKSRKERVERRFNITVRSRCDKANTIILLNGPPGIGKDTIANEFITAFAGFQKMEYKEGLRNATLQRYEVADREEGLRQFECRKAKDSPSELFQGRTPREALIETDTFLKNEYGRSMAGEWAASAVQANIQLCGIQNFLFSDSGFVQEAYQVAEKVDRVVVVQLHHPDFNFDNDSRDYIEINDKNIVTVKYNRLNGDPEVDARNIHALVSDTIWERRLNN